MFTPHKSNSSFLSSVPWHTFRPALSLYHSLSLKLRFHLYIVMHIETNQINIWWKWQILNQFAFTIKVRLRMICSKLTVYGLPWKMYWVSESGNSITACTVGGKSCCWYLIQDMGITVISILTQIFKKKKKENLIRPLMTHCNNSCIGYFFLWLQNRFD